MKPGPLRGHHRELIRRTADDAVFNRSPGYEDRGIHILNEYMGDVVRHRADRRDLHPCWGDLTRSALPVDIQLEIGEIGSVDGTRSSAAATQSADTYGWPISSMGGRRQESRGFVVARHGNFPLTN